MRWVRRRVAGTPRTDLIAKFDDAARDAGAQNDAAHFQASVVQLTENTVRVYGTDTFAGSVLAAVGLDRPAAQRFTDKPYEELGTTDADYRDRRRGHRLRLVRIRGGQGQRTEDPRRARRGGPCPPPRTTGCSW